MAAEYGSGGSFTVAMDGPFATGGGSITKITSIQAPAADWKGGESPYSQVIAVDGISVNSKVDIQLSVDQMELFFDQTIAFTTENDGGVVTLYAIGDKPQADCELQATLSDVVNAGTGGHAIIRGNTVSTNMPRSDYAQTDPEKADFILNKPDVAIQKAQATADAALPKVGGAITGELSMSDNKVTNLGDPENDTDAANKGYVGRYVDSKHLSVEVNLEADAWEGDEAPYTQTIDVEGILATDQPHYGLVYSDDLDTKLAQKEAFSQVDDLETADGSVTFTCFEDKPEIDLSVQLEVNR